MRPPTSQSQSQSQNSYSTEYYYFVGAIVLVAALLLIINIFGSGCWPSSSNLVRAIKRLLMGGGAPSDRDDPISNPIPIRKYRKEQAASGNECSVCLTVLEEGDEVRILPRCEHSFHAPCIDMWLYCHVSCPLCRANVLPVPQRCAKAEARSQSLLESGTLSGVSRVVGLF